MHDLYLLDIIQTRTYILLLINGDNLLLFVQQNKIHEKLILNFKLKIIYNMYTFERCQCQCSVDILSHMNILIMWIIVTRLIIRYIVCLAEKTLNILEIYIPTMQTCFLKKNKQNPVFEVNVKNCQVTSLFYLWNKIHISPKSCHRCAYQ